MTLCDNSCRSVSVCRYTTTHSTRFGNYSRTRKPSPECRFGQTRPAFPHPASEMKRHRPALHIDRCYIPAANPGSAPIPNHKTERRENGRGAGDDLKKKKRKGKKDDAHQQQVVGGSSAYTVHHTTAEKPRTTRQKIKQT